VKTNPAEPVEKQRAVSSPMVLGIGAI
jgi:hypothetical protein